MPRPKKKRNIVCIPGISYFKPRGVPLRSIKEVAITMDEYEAIRLADLLGLAHEEAGKRMGVSRATFGRIVQNARRSVAEALVKGMAIKIEDGRYDSVEDRIVAYMCEECGRRWEFYEEPDLEKCPLCSHENLQRV